MYFDEITFTSQCKKEGGEEKKVKGFKFCTFMGGF